MSTKTIADYDAAVAIDATGDYLLIEPSGNTVYKKINRNTLLGLASAPIGTTDTQSPTNKTFDNTNAITVKDGSFTLQNTSATTKQAVFSNASITAGQTRTFTFPDASGTLATIAGTQTLTNKTLISPTITGGTYANGTITVDSIAEYTAANGITIDGLNIKDGALNTANSVVTANYTDGSILPEHLVTSSGTSWVWQSWTPTLTNITAGNGTTVAKYTQIGKTIHFQFSFTAGATSSSSGVIRMTLPTSMSSNYRILGAGDSGNGYMANIVYANVGVAGNYGICQIYDADELVLQVQLASGTYVAAGAIDMDASAVPFQLATADNIFVWGTYEAA